MRNRLLFALPLAALLMLPCASQERVKGTFTLPNSVLLFQTSVPGVPGEPLIAVSTTGAIVVQAKAGFWGQMGTVPALAPGTDRVAWSLGLHDASEPTRLRSVFGVYSLLDKTWTTYGDFCGGSIGSQVFSSDGSKIAFAAQSRLSSGHSDCIHSPLALRILDIATGKLTLLPYNGRIFESARLGWSPDGKYLVGQIGAWVDPFKQIVVIDVESGSSRIIAEGMNPSWSPKGDWIAYEDDKGLKCMLIHPDGTGAKAVLDLEKRFHGYRTFLQGAVWSPDGEKLLFNEQKGDSDGIDVTMLDLASGKVTTKCRNGPAVLGWVTDRR
jgi:hypothetical protein